MDSPKGINHRKRPSDRFIVSACLAGVRCCYDGKDRIHSRVRRMVDEGIALPVCPEVLGGRPIPRDRCEIRGGDGGKVLSNKAKVVTESGNDISRKMILGAKRALTCAKIFGANSAILKSKSPSCGVGMIYDGSFSGKLVIGNGVTAELLLKNNIFIQNEKDRTYGRK